MKNVSNEWTQRWEVVARNGSARGAGAFARAPRSTLVGSAASHGVGGIFSSRAAYKLQHPCKTSGWAAIYGRLDPKENYRTRNARHCCGSRLRKVCPAPGRNDLAAAEAGAPAWRRRFLPSIDRAGRQSPCGDWRHAPNETIQSSARSSEKQKAGTPKVAGSHGHQPPLGDAANINTRLIYANNTYR